MALAAFTRLDHLPGFSSVSHELQLCEWWLGAQNHVWEQRNPDFPPRSKASSFYLSMPWLAHSNIKLMLSCLPTQWTLEKLWDCQMKMQQEMHFSLKEINGKLESPIFRMYCYLRYFGWDFCHASRHLQISWLFTGSFRSDWVPALTSCNTGVDPQVPVLGQLLICTIRIWPRHPTPFWELNMRLKIMSHIPRLDCITSVFGGGGLFCFLKYVITSKISTQCKAKRKAGPLFYNA